LLVRSKKIKKPLTTVPPPAVKFCCLSFHAERQSSFFG